MPKKLNIQPIIDKLQSFYQQNKRPPSYEEIRILLGYKSKNSALWVVNKLIEKNILQRDVKGKLLLNIPFGIKLLGNIQAGWPSPAEEELRDTLSLDEFMIKNPQQSYLVRVNGDSMKDAGLIEGDLVIVERGRQAKNGDIVIAQIDGEWTMKYYEKYGKKCRLIPANKRFKIIEPKEELIIGGVVTGSLRKYQ